MQNPSWFNSLAVAIILVECSCDRTSDERLVLMQAVHRGDVAQVRKMIEEGVEVNFVERSPDRFTPLLRACYAGQYEVASLLIEAGADVSAKDAFGRTPLEYAIGSSEASAILVEELVAHGADREKAIGHLHLTNIHPRIRSLLESDNLPSAGTPNGRPK